MSIDDEAALHEALDDLIDWGSLGIEHSAAFTNPEEALDHVLAQRPDVIIVDIRMPRLDGLELLRLVRDEEVYRPRVVILSGYREFSYAREALRLGVSGYLLKPIDESELRAMLERVAEELRAPARGSEGLPQVVRRTIDGLATDDDHDRVVAHTREAEPVGFRYALIVAHEKTREPRMSPQTLSRALSATAFDDSSDLVYRGERDVFHWIAAEPASVSASDSIEKSYEGIRRRAVEKAGMELSIVVGPLVEHPSGVPKSREQVRTVMNRVYLFAGPGLTLAEHHLFDSAGVVSTTLAGELMDDLIQGEGDRVRSRLSGLLETTATRSADTESLRMFCLALITDIHRTLEELDAEQVASIVPARRIVQNLESTPLVHVRSALDALVIEARGRIRTQIEMGRSGLVQLAQRRLERAFDQPISLKQVAGEYGVSAEHLGQLFRKFVGKGFKEYLREVRVREAGRLLRSTDLRVPEVAARVGYQDTDYFTDQFKRETGQTPAAWRRSSSTDDE